MMNDYDQRGFTFDRMSSPPLSPPVMNQSINQQTPYHSRSGQYRHQQQQPFQFNNQSNNQQMNNFNNSLYDDLTNFAGFPRIDSFASLASFDQPFPQSNNQSPQMYMHSLNQLAENGVQPVENNQPIDQSVSHVVNSDLVGAFAPDDFSPLLTGASGTRYQSNYQSNNQQIPSLAPPDQLFNSTHQSHDRDESVNQSMSYHNAFLNQSQPSRQLRQKQSHSSVKLPMNQAMNPPVNSHLNHPMNSQLNQSRNPQLSHPLNQSINQSLNQKSGQLVDSNAASSRKRALEADINNSSMHHTMYPTNHHSINQSVNQPVNQPLHQSVNQVRHAPPYNSYPMPTSFNQSANYSQHMVEQSVNQNVFDQSNQSNNQSIHQSNSQSNNHQFSQFLVMQSVVTSLEPTSDQSINQKALRKSACVSCYNAKIHCNGGRPCAKCEAKGIVCEDRAKQTVVSTKGKTKKRKVSKDENDQTTKPNSTLDLTSNEAVKKEAVRSDESESVASTSSSDRSSHSATEPLINDVSTLTVKSASPSNDVTSSAAEESKTEEVKVETPTKPTEPVDPAREASHRMLSILLHEKSDLPGTIKAGLKMGTVTPVNLHALLSYFSRTLYPEHRETLMEEVRKLLAGDPNLSKIVISSSPEVAPALNDHSSIYMPDGSRVPRVNFNFFRSPLDTVPESPIGVDHPMIWIFRLWPDHEKSNNESIKKFFRRMYKQGGQTVPDIYMPSKTHPQAPFLASMSDGVNLIVQVNRAFELLFDYRQSEMRALMQKEGTHALYRLYRPESLFEIGGWLTQAICGLRHDFKAEVKLIRKGSLRHMDGIMNARFTLDHRRQFESVGYTYVTKTRNS